MAAQVDLSGLVNGQSTLQNWAMANAAGTIIALILIAIVLMRKK